MKFERFLPAFAALLLLWSGPAKAARNAWVIGAGGNGGASVLRQAPTSSSQPLATLQSGDPITISNYPTNGFYKARSASGQIGWIAVTDVGNTPPASQTTPIPLPAPSAPQTSAGPPPSEPEDETIPYRDVQPTGGGEEQSESQQPSGPRTPFEIRAFGGVQSLPTVISFSQIGVSLYSSMPYFGLQLGIPATRRLYVLLRLERLSRSSSAGGYNFSLSATPLTTGLSYQFLPEDAGVRLRGSVLLGVAFGTTLDAMATSLPAPNQSELSTQAFTEMLKMDFDVPVSPHVALFAEGGYRFLNSSSIGPSSAVNGSSIFQSGGTTVPISLDLSGFFGGGGLAFYL